MCKYLDVRDVVAGWGCHACHLYNGLQRKACRGCGGARCAPLSPDEHTGRTFETFEEAYADDPRMLAQIRAQLGGGS